MDHTVVDGPQQRWVGERMTRVAPPVPETPEATASAAELRRLLERAMEGVLLAEHHLDAVGPLLRDGNLPQVQERLAAARTALRRAHGLETP